MCVSVMEHDSPRRTTPLLPWPGSVRADGRCTVKREGRVCSCLSSEPYVSWGVTRLRGLPLSLIPLKFLVPCRRHRGVDLGMGGAVCYRRPG
ncbi:hypothetical protein E2C01_086727 [Portunus trituberculatus]|uniref:Uncharacterized protein n=1 Tax=Portunus trituberculatus TaxID=210409 RepID=A0A5B7JBB6_PORTR|nr:hypothetical protein [Portunus trituberculatus]